MPNTTIAPAGAATFMVPRIRLREGSVGMHPDRGIVGVVRELRGAVFGFDLDRLGERRRARAEVWSSPRRAPARSPASGARPAGERVEVTHETAEDSHARQSRRQCTADVSSAVGSAAARLTASEPELEPELNHSRAAARPRDLAEVGGADVPRRIAERRRVGDVVRLDPELQGLAGRQPGDLRDAEIDAPLIGTDDGVPSEVAELGSGALEGVAVQIVVQARRDRTVGRLILVRRAGREIRAADSSSRRARR